MDIGAELRAAREARGLTIDTLSGRTRVPARTLAAIERNDSSALPPHPFGRGFVRTYADELDLDHERVVREFFAQFPTPVTALPSAAIRVNPDEWQNQSRWTGVGTAVAILLVVVSAAVMLGRRQATSESGTVGTSGAAASSAEPVATADRAPAAAPSQPATAPTASASPLTVTMTFSRQCWVAATVDGQRTLYRILQANEPQTLSAEREITLRVGDAGAVRWAINGRDAGIAGADGAIRNMRVTLGNAATVK